MLEEVRGEPAVMYQADLFYVRLRAMRNLLEEHDDLEELLSDLEEQIEDWREMYGAESPKSLREMVAEADAADQTRELRWAANAWEMIDYRLQLISEAIDRQDQS